MESGTLRSFEKKRWVDGLAAMKSMRVSCDRLLQVRGARNG